VVAIGLVLLISGVGTVAVHDPSASSNLRGAASFLRRLQSVDCPQIHCTEDFGGYVNHTSGQPVQTQCPEAQQCACSHIEEGEGKKWHCREEAAKVPCGVVPEKPTAYPREVFFSSFKADMTSLYSGSSAIWNSTGWWVFDVKDHRERMDITTHVRSLHQGSHLSTFRHSVRTLAAPAPDPGGGAGVEAENMSKEQVVTYDVSARDLFSSGKAPTCNKSSRGRIQTQPLAGDALRFLPPEFRPMGWSTREDRYLGTALVDGWRQTAAWGWTETRGRYEVGGHRVYIDFDGTPVREEQWYSLGGQGTYATVQFQRPEDAYGSFDALQANTDELFRLPPSCN